MLGKFLEQPNTVIETQSVDPSEQKLCDIIKNEIDVDAEIGIVGIPYDVGVEFSNGRTGARKAPDKIRKQLSNYGTTFNIDYNTDISNVSIVDFGNIIIDDTDPRETYYRIEKTIYEMVKREIIPIVLGGGHDITYPCIRGFSQHFNRIGGINIDVHFDVRKQQGEHVSSGMGFRKILEDIKNNPLQGVNFIEIGADGTVNAKKYVDYLIKKRAIIYPIKKIRDVISEKKDIEDFIHQACEIAAKSTDAVFTSLDIDSVSFDAAPGCSFTNPNGFSTDEISRIAHAIGYNENVSYFDIVEVNPKFDVDDRTTRLCARVISCFLTGYAQRRIIKHQRN